MLPHLLLACLLCKSTPPPPGDLPWELLEELDPECQYGWVPIGHLDAEEARSLLTVCGWPEYLVDARVFVVLEYTLPRGYFVGARAHVIDNGQHLTVVLAGDGAGHAF